METSHQLWRFTFFCISTFFLLTDSIELPPSPDDPSGLSSFSSYLVYLLIILLFIYLFINIVILLSMSSTFCMMSYYLKLLEPNGQLLSFHMHSVSKISLPREVKAHNFIFTVSFISDRNKDIKLLTQPINMI